MRVVSVTGRHVTPLVEGWELTTTAANAVGSPTMLPSALDWIPAVVPGTAAEALRRAGRWNDDQPPPLHDRDVWYRTRFVAEGDRTLHFGGLATFAEAWLNGIRVLVSDNMFVTHEIDVGLTGAVDLLIAFRALDRVLEARRGRARWRTRLVQNNALRWARTTLLGHMTGWQPAVHAVGPWRPVELIEQSPDLRLRTADLRTTLDGNDGLVSVDIAVDCEGDRPAATLTVGDSTGRLGWTDAHHLSGALRLHKVERWWPHTHGTPALHRVQLRIGDAEVDLGRTGFRTIERDRSGGFGLVLNGQRIFARGACWSAADLVSLAGDRARLSPWLELARDAHMNMVRVGGTMVYESDDFFDLCDELGILVWHDFMFANMDYPIADLGFRTGIEAEAAQFLDRTQGHPCLAVLCGGSEVAQQAAMLGLPPASWSSPLFDEILPAAATQLRPDVVYVPHSPVGGDLPFAVGSGVSHYYGVGAYRRSLDDARRAGVRFTSECLAFANVPVAATTSIAWADPDRWQAAVPRDRGADWDFEDVRDHYVERLFGVEPKALRAADPTRYLRLGRAATALAMEATITEWRRPGSSCRGALVWMLKDFVAGAGWGVIDATGAPKAAWHALRRAFRPVQVALTDEGLDGLAIHLLNDTAASIQARLSLLCLRDHAVPVLRRQRELELAPRSGLSLSSAELIGSFFDITYAYHFGQAPLDATIVTLDDVATGRRLGEAVHFPLGRQTPDFPEPGLSVEVVRDPTGWSLRLQATRLASGVLIEDPHYRAADEGFALLPGERRDVPLIALAQTDKTPNGKVFATARAVGVAYPGGHISIPPP
jgi:beta-mannosidase